MKATGEDSRKATLSRRLWPGLLFLAAILGAIFLLRTERPQLHKGKPINYWVYRACLYQDGSGPDGTSSWDLRNEVKNIGPAAVPYLIRRLRTDGRWDNTKSWLWNKLPAGLQKYFPEPHAANEIRYGAARTLALFGPEAKAAVPDLMRALADKNQADPVIEALTAIGPGAVAAIPVLHLMLTNVNPGMRVELAGALWCIGRETNTVLQICMNEMTPSAGDGEAMNAAYLLGQLKEGGASAVPLELDFLRDTNHSPETRGNCAIALGAAGVSSPEILAALLAATSEREKMGLRCNAALSLWRFDPQYAPMALRLVVGYMAAERSQKQPVEENIALWLEARDLDLTESIPLLKQLSEGGPMEIQKEAAMQLKNVERKIASGEKR